MFFYFSRYIGVEEVEVECPSCGTPFRLSSRTDFEGLQWSAHCARCGALYGVVNEQVAQAFVSPKWTTKKTPEPVYVDIIIVRRADLAQGRGVETCFRRWHGWVDLDTREIVQEG